VAEDAFERGLQALSHKERTTAELVDWLAERGFAREEIESAVVRLIEARALDDERFAHEFAADKRELRGWGPDRIRAALSSRGLDPGLIEAAAGGEGHGDQVERAISLLERRGDSLDDERSRARALGYLARRGFETEVAYEAVRGLERRLAA
jgi:regulatory protein